MKRRYRDRLIIVFLFAGAIVARSNPTGGAVTAGSASIAGQGTSTVQINQASNTAIINWQTFSIGSGELTKFVQPSSSSATLNRVLGGQTSIIDGTLSANGQIYLLNGNGIVVGPGGVINTAGFTGSTRDISDPDFLSGNLHFTGSGKAGVKNYGTINALGGDVVLIGKTVDNAGTINATGTAGLIAGDDVLLAQNNADGSTITVNPVSAPVATRAKVGVLNTGTITASSAELKAANGNIYALAIQNEGIIRATTVSHQGGHIYLTSDTGTVSNTGTLDASATVAGGKGGTILVKSTSGKVVHSGKIIARGGQGGAGGNAEVSGAQLEFTGSIDLTAPGGTTGNLLLDPGTLTVLAGTGGTVDVITPGSPNDDENDPGPSTIGAGLVDSILNGANLTLNADTNITVNSAISWNAATTLTLSTNSTAGTSIAINASITDSNTTQGGLTIDTRNAADPISATGAISVANFILQNGAWTQNVAPNAITGVSQLPGFTTTHDFEINGGTFLRSNGGNGGTTLINGSQVDTPYLISDVYGLQGINGFLSSDFTIYQSAIDASGTSSWNNGLGFIPIGFSTPTGATVNPYTGNFYGGEIDNLTIHQATTNADTNSVGLVADLQGSITYLNLTGASITGYGNVGAMAGLNEGTIFNTSISSTTVTGNNSVGFDAGDNEGYIQYCYVNSGTVTGVSLVGGIAGLNNNLVQGGSSGGTVNGTTEVGGVVGENDSSVDGVGGYAAVNGNTQVGGIVGLNIGTVDASTGSATVTGTDTSTVQSAYVGGLVGENDGTVTTSSTTTSSVVSGDLQVGGLVGYNTGTITDVPLEGGSVAGSFNSGSVTGNASTISGDVGSIDIGGVAGLNTGLVMDSYNTGAVTGRTDVGGVAGENQQVETGGFNSDFRTEDFSDQPTFSAAAIQTSYNSGTVAGSGASNGVGGIVGLNDSGASVNTTYNVGAIGNGNSIAAGGIVGINAGIVIDTYNSGAVTGVRSGGLIGTEQTGATATNSYWDETTSGQTAAVGTGTADASLLGINIAGSPSPYSSATYVNFDNGSPSLTHAVANTNGVVQIGLSPNVNGPAWYIIEGSTRPLLAMELSTNIQNAHQLQLIAANLSGTYTLSQSFTAAATAQVNGAEVWNPTTGFVPIGRDPDSGTPFTGSLDGQSNTVDGLYINLPSSSEVGLFGYNEGTVSNLNLSTFQVAGDDDVGAKISPWFKGAAAPVTWAELRARIFTGIPSPSRSTVEISARAWNPMWAASSETTRVRSMTVTAWLRRPSTVPQMWAA
jgi:filamentous hemagglutinin family protein